MSTYPATKDDLTESFSDSTTAAVNHPAAHNDANSAINAIQDTLGVNPQGSSGTVATRMTAIESAAQVVTAGDGLDLDDEELSVDNTVVREGDARLTNARTPTAHTHPPSQLTQGGAASGQVLAWNGSAWTPSTVEAGSGSGGGGTAYTAGDGLDLTGAEFAVDSSVVRDDDARLTDQRTPSDNSVTSAKIANGAITNDDINATAAIAESKLNLASDAAAGTASRRTLGTGATQAAAGNHSHTTFSTAITVGAATSANHATRATQVATMVSHGSTAGTTRPAGFGFVIWVGSVEPTNSVDGDLWVSTA